MAANGGGERRGREREGEGKEKGDTMIFHHKDNGFHKPYLSY